MSRNRLARPPEETGPSKLASMRQRGRRRDCQVPQRAAVRRGLLPIVGDYPEHYRACVQVAMQQSGLAKGVVRLHVCRTRRIWRAVTF